MFDPVKIVRDEWPVIQGAPWLTGLTVGLGIIVLVCTWWVTILTYSTNLGGSCQKCVGHSCPTHWFQHEFRTEMPGVGVSERSACRGTAPTGHGPAGWKLGTKPPNSSASGQAAAKAMRTRVAVSLIRAAILIRRI